jgi:hypothetical protein
MPKEPAAHMKSETWSRHNSVYHRIRLQVARGSTFDRQVRQRWNAPTLISHWSEKFGFAI